MEIQAYSSTNLQVKIAAGKHRFISDEPLGVGDDAGPNPYDYLLSALAACKIITVQMYANRKGWNLEDVRVSLSTRKVHAKDCENCESDPNAKVDLIDCRISFHGDLDEAQLQRLTEISEKCPVQRTLTSETKIRTQRVEASEIASVDTSTQ